MRRAEALNYLPGMATVAAACPVCPAGSSALHASGRDFEYGTTSDTEWTIHRCGGCGTLFLSPRPDPTELSRIYPANYYAYDFRTQRTLGYRVKALMDRRAIRGYLSCASTPGPILDVGCGDGRLLEGFAARGVPRGSLYGLEISAESAARARALGFHITCGRFEDAQLPRNYFELIVMQQVLEHLSDPNDVIAKLRDLLTPSGAVVIETPNAQSWDHAIFARRYWGGYHIPRHFFLFSPSSIRRLLERHDMEVVAIRFLPSPSFWVQSIHHLALERAWPAVTRLFHPQRPNAVVLAMFTALDLVGGPFHLTSNMRIVARRRTK